MKRKLNALPYWFFLHIFENSTFSSTLFSAVHYTYDYFYCNYTCDCCTMYVTVSSSNYIFPCLTPPFHSLHFTTFVNSSKNTLWVKIIYKSVKRVIQYFWSPLPTMYCIIMFFLLFFLHLKGSSSGIQHCIISFGLWSYDVNKIRNEYLS